MIQRRITTMKTSLMFNCFINSILTENLKVHLTVESTPQTMSYDIAAIGVEERNSMT